MPADPRLKALFAAAADLDDPADRAALLDRECGADPDLRRRVEDLLRAHDRPASALERPLAVPPDPGTRALPPGDATVDRPPEPTDAVGDRIGPYKLLERIGEGGMGEVWVADQLEPIKRRVALKLIKPGMDSRSVLARFEAERQALAVMDHPHIARVFDAGTAADGRPYFVMELVKGTPITEFADARRLTPKQRLELFVPVCQAIQHAHLKGVIHRDIKPGNVLVELHDDRAVVKVIDFGVAKAVGQQLTEKTIYTGFGALVGTPAYMAPEQATFNAVDVDTRADVYALGVLLYELLAGSPPIEKERLKKAALDEVLRIVREEEPPRPSQRLSTSQARAGIAATRGSEPAKLSALMKGELDWIVMKALEKDRTRRYETANGFAADVQRYLSGEPVQAVPPSVVYRLRKFARKHRGPVIAAAVVVLAVLLGVTGTTGGMVWAMGAERQAVEERKKAERERGNAVDAQAEAEAARKAAERKALAAAVDLDIKFCEVEPPRGILRLAQRLKTLPPDDTELRQYVTLSLFAHAQRQARLVPYNEPLGGVSPDGRLGYRVRANGEAELVHPLTGARLTLLGENVPAQSECRFSPDGRLAALVLGDEVRVYDLQTFRRHSTLRPGGPAGWQVILNGNCTRAVVWREEEAGGARPGRRASYQLWDVAANRPLADLHRVEWGWEDGITPDTLCKFSPDGRVLITVGDGGPARVWSADDGRVLHTLTGHTADVRFADFSADGRSAATGSNAEVLWWTTADWRTEAAPCPHVIDHPWVHSKERPIKLWGVARMLADGVLAVAVQHGQDNRDGTTHCLYVRGEPAAHRCLAVASDGRVAVDFDGVYSLRPFRDWQSADGRRFPADYGGPLVDGRYLLLHSGVHPFGWPDRLIDLGCDRPVGAGYSDLAPCNVKGCAFVARHAEGQKLDLRSPIVLPAEDANFDPDTLELWAKVLTCGQLNPVSGFFEPLDEPAWERNRQELLRRAKPPGEFPFPGPFASDRLFWLRNQDLERHEHLLDRLVAEEPTAENHRARANVRWTAFRKDYHLALRDMLAAEDLDRKAGLPAERDTADRLAEIVYKQSNRPEDYEMALKYLDTRSNRDRFRVLRGLALYRLSRHREALDLLLADETEWTNSLITAGGGPAVLQPEEERTLAIGLCLLKLGKPGEAVARLQQARVEHKLREPSGPWPHLLMEPSQLFLIEAEAEIGVTAKPPEPKK